MKIISFCFAAVVVLLSADFTLAQANSVSLASASAGPNAPFVSVQELATSRKAKTAFEKGAKLLKKGEIEASVSYFQTAIELAPSNYASYHNLALAQYRLRQFDESTQNFQRSIDLTKGSFAPSLFGLSMVLYSRNEFSEAMSLIQRGLLVAPASAVGKLCLGLVQYSMGRTADAQQSALDALRLDPRLTDSHLLLAHIYERLHAPAAVLADVHAYLASSPTGDSESDALALRARAQQEANNPRGPN